MINCPSCNHQNPEGSLQCENCYTPLPATIGCPNCGASVQTDATFCGQCGFNLQAEGSPGTASLEETAFGAMPSISLEEMSLPDELPVSQGSPDILPEATMPSPIQSPWDEEELNETNHQTLTQNPDLPTEFPEAEPAVNSNFTSELPETEFVETNSNSAYAPDNVTPLSPTTPDLDLDLDLESDTSTMESAAAANSQTSYVPSQNENPAPKSISPPVNQSFGMTGGMPGATQLQIQKASLLHLQSNTTIEIPTNLDVVHFGKPNGQIPPDVDVSGFPDSEVVSRVHADIRIEGDTYYVEDTGSSNGTYVNHAPLHKGNRHRLRTGDRIALGKGDLVTFIFQLS